MGLYPLQCLEGKRRQFRNPKTGKVVVLFHPRRDRWSDHFEMRGHVIEPLTATGTVTVRLLRLNSEQRVAERRVLD